MMSTRIWNLLLMFAIGVMFVGSASASANAFEDIAHGVGKALGVSDSGATYTGGLLLGTAFLITVGLILAMLEMNPMGIVIVELGVVGLFVAIGWLDLWMLVMAALIVAGFWGTKMVIWSQGRGEGD